MAKKAKKINQRTRWSFATAAINFLFGRRLASGEDRQEEIGPWAGIPILGLDALSSASYGPEAALTILLPLGILAPREAWPITLIIVAMLALVAFSYKQTIGAYPGGGGSYTVAKENLGQRWGLLAGAALSVDYILNVAVGISAGVAAIGSAYPPMLRYTLPCCLGLLGLLTLINLRGVREAGFAFMVPTYVFIACMLVALGVGIGKAILNHGHPVPIAPPPHLPQPTSAITLWLLVRAFANGTTALTGVEAVSNAVPIFREPKVKNASRTLMAIITILIVLLLGVSFVCRAYGIGATEPGTPGYQSVLSQLIGAVAGRGWFYYVSMGAIFCVLALSANTSFAGFPRLCRLMALDQYLPEAFAHRGRRLVYNYGIALLALFSCALLLIFRGITNGLIPLFAVGALLAFTMSQSGMVEHWRQRRNEPRAKAALCVNAAGALATGLTVCIVMVSKFVEGAWITILLIPLIMLAMNRLKMHQRRLAAAVECHEPINFCPVHTPIMVVPLTGWTRVGEKALLFATRLSPEVHAVQVLTEEVPKEDLSQHWDEYVQTPAREAGLNPPTLKVVHSRYRQELRPVVNFVRELLRENPGRTVGVVVPEVVERRWYHYFLSYATLLRGMLLLRGNPRIVIMTMPWYAKINPQGAT
jgi:amino acid transporter